MPVEPRTPANVLEKSLRYAGILDGSSNILPVRDGARDGGGDSGTGGITQDTSSGNADGAGGHDEVPLPPDTLSMEIPVGDERKVLIRYPRDLSSAEAKKVGNVLNAVVG